MYNNLGSFDDASSKLLHIINSSDSESASNLGRGLRRKKKCMRSLFQNVDDDDNADSSSDENEEQSYNVQVFNIKVLNQQSF